MNVLILGDYQFEKIYSTLNTLADNIYVVPDRSIENSIHKQYCPDTE